MDHYAFIVIVPIMKARQRHWAEMEMELARPHIFLSGHASHLEDALGCYMDMIDSYLYNWDSFKWIIEVKSINDIQIKFNFSNISIMFRCIQFLISWRKDLLELLLRITTRSSTSSTLSTCSTCRPAITNRFCCSIMFLFLPFEIKSFLNQQAERLKSRERRPEIDRLDG